MKINVAILDIIFVFSFQVSSWFYLSCGGLNEIGGVETTLFGLFYPHLHLSWIRRSECNKSTIKIIEIYLLIRQ